MADTKNLDNIIDIDLSSTKKKRFRIDGDDNKIIELNTADMDIQRRLTTAYKEIREAFDNAYEKFNKLPNADVEDDEALMKETEEIYATLDEVEAIMREKIDYIFDSKISDICVPKGSGTMYDLFEGTFRFEYLINKLTALYEDNLNLEYKKLKARMDKHTDKYVSKKKNRR